jgi:hypothetical protein
VRKVTKLPNFCLLQKGTKTVLCNKVPFQKDVKFKNFRLTKYLKRILTFRQIEINYNKILKYWNSITLSKNPPSKYSFGLYLFRNIDVYKDVLKNKVFNLFQGNDCEVIIVSTKLYLFLKKIDCAQFGW